MDGTCSTVSRKNKRLVFNNNLKHRVLLKSFFPITLAAFKLFISFQEIPAFALNFCFFHH